MKNLKIVFFSLLLFFLLSANTQASTSSSPIISDLNSSIKSFSEPFVSGSTDKFTSVLVYIDGNFWSEAETVSSPSRDLFYFFLNRLPSEGTHSLFLISRDLNGVLSAPTKEFDFLISYKLNSPKILKSSFENSVYFYGESLNENFVEMYVDGSLFSTFFIERNSTNTFVFSEKNISKGDHEIFFIARDKVGRKSNLSNKVDIYYNKIEEIYPSEAVLDNQFNDIKKENEVISRPSISEKGVDEVFDEEIIVEGINNIEKKKELEQKEKSEEEILDNILKEISEDISAEVGAISENGEKQSDLQWNLVIFLAFLVAVILWIIWVNREIKDEDDLENPTIKDDRTEQENKEKK